MPVRPWVPTDLTSAVLEGWWYLRNPFKAAGDAGRDGEQLTLLNADVVGWKDVSGKSHDLVATTSSARPTYSVNGLKSGTPGLSFNGSSNVLKCQLEQEVSGGAPTKRFGAFASFSIDTNPATTPKRIISLSARTGSDTSTGTAPILIGYNAQAFSSYIYSQNGSSATATPTLSLSNHIAYGGPISATTIGIKLNGASATTLTNNTPRSIETMGVGAQFDSSSYTNFELAEHMLISGEITSAEIILMEGYLAWNTESQSKLPSGHTYKSARPTINADYPETVPLNQVFHRRRLVGVN